MVNLFIGAAIARDTGIAKPADRAGSHLDSVLAAVESFNRHRAKKHDRGGDLGFRRRPDDVTIRGIYAVRDRAWITRRYYPAHQCSQSSGERMGKIRARR